MLVYCISNLDYGVSMSLIKLRFYLLSFLFLNLLFYRFLVHSVVILYFVGRQVKYLLMFRLVGYFLEYIV